jgi:outer membrane protein assembly factor BamD (BamD/ComL family)
MGSVKFYREDYKEADRYFSQLVDYHPRSKFAPQAMEYAIISKHLSTGGADYDSRKVAEARKYVDAALRNYVLPSDKNAFLERQLAGITMQQAEKDFKIAEFYRRTGHPGSAYFYYEIVRRRYPGTPFFDQATERMYELKADKEAGKIKPAVQFQPPAPTLGQGP